MNNESRSLKSKALESREHELRIESRNLDELRPDPRNARKHPKENLNAIKKSLERFGQALPIVVAPDGTVIGGNGTLAAARDLGWERIETVVYDGENSRALAVALNQTALSAQWDRDILAEALLEAEELQIDPAELGFQDRDLDALFPPAEMQDMIEPMPQTQDTVLAPFEPVGSWRLTVLCESEEQRLELQRELLERGFDVGEA